MFFTAFLLGLDGENSIGNTQHTYKIYDEEGNLISNCGELEASAYEYFHEGKYEEQQWYITYFKISTNILW